MPKNNKVEEKKKKAQDFKLIHEKTLAIRKFHLIIFNVPIRLFSLVIFYGFRKRFEMIKKDFVNLSF